MSTPRLTPEQKAEIQEEVAEHVVAQVRYTRDLRFCCVRCGASLLDGLSVQDFQLIHSITVAIKLTEKALSAESRGNKIQPNVAGWMGPAEQANPVAGRGLTERCPICRHELGIHDAGGACLICPCDGTEGSRAAVESHVAETHHFKKPKKRG